MKTLVTLLLLALLASSKADTLTWDYDHGWTDGFVMTIDTITGKVTVHDRENDWKSVVVCRNSKSIVTYIRSLLSKIPEKGIGEAMDDGEVNKISIKSKEGLMIRKIYGELGRTLAEDNKHLFSSVSEEAGYLAMDMLPVIKKMYSKLPPKEPKK